MEKVLTKMPNICVSVAAGHIGGLRRDAEIALWAGANYAELRFDMLRPEELRSARALEAFRHLREKLVFTLRSEGQGGNFKGPPDEAASLLEMLCSGMPMLLDVEFQLARQMPRLLNRIRAKGISVLLSHHDYSGTPQEEELNGLLGRMEVYSNWMKIVTMAHSSEDGSRMIGLYREIHESVGVKLVSFAMGEEGRVSRIASGLAPNSPFAFACLDRPISPSQ